MALTPTSLRQRIVVGTTGAILLAMAVLVAGLYAVQQHATQADAESVLASRAAAVAATVQESGGHVVVLETPADTLDQAVWVYDSTGTLIDGRLPAGALAGEVQALSRAATPSQVAAADHHLLRAIPVKGADGRPFATVVAGVDLAPYEAAVTRGLWLSVLLGAAAVLASAAASWAASGRALQRVHTMARQADDWREHDLERRFPQAGGDELADLGSTLNRMLGRISAAIHSERRLTDGVAHELRTPLTVIHTEAQLALSTPEATTESLEAILRASERMSTSIDTLLAAARGEHDPEATSHSHDVLTEALKAAPTRSGVTIELDSAAPGLAIGAPQAVAAAALKPLVDNAVRHASSMVRLYASTTDDAVLLHVDDDGPGITIDLVESVFTPGHSGSGRDRGGSGTIGSDAGGSGQSGHGSAHSGQGRQGSGLGLPLARRLARSVGGHVEARPGGSGHFVVTLPRP